MHTDIVITLGMEGGSPPWWEIFQKSLFFSLKRICQNTVSPLPKSSNVREYNFELR